jgi:hypothetical protein
MKKKLIICVALSTVWIFSLMPLAVVATTQTAFASGIVPACSNPAISGTNVCKDATAPQNPGQNTLIVIIKDVINVISFIVGVASFFIILISGMKMVLSGGDTKAVSEAKGGIFGAVIGILVVILAQSFVVFVIDKVK